MKLKTKLSCTNVQEHEKHRSQLHVSTASPSDASEKSGATLKTPNTTAQSNRSFVNRYWRAEL